MQTLFFRKNTGAIDKIDKIITEDVILYRLNDISPFSAAVLQRCGSSHKRSFLSRLIFARVIKMLAVPKTYDKTFGVLEGFCHDRA